MSANLGDVVIDLDGQKQTLRCTLGAAEAITLSFGSYNKAYARIGDFDFAAFVAVIASGLGKEGKDIKEAVFKTGLPPLVKPLTTYLELLSNGGRPQRTENVAPGEG